MKRILAVFTILFISCSSYAGFEIGETVLLKDSKNGKKATVKSVKTIGEVDIYTVELENGTYQLIPSHQLARLIAEEPRILDKNSQKPAPATPSSKVPDEEVAELISSVTNAEKTLAGTINPERCAARNQSTISVQNLREAHARTEPESSFLGNRPKHVQNAVDMAFEKLQSDRKTENEGWLFNGTEDKLYSIAGIDEAKLIREIASKADGKKDVYFVDVGSGSGGWGRAAMKLLETEFNDSGKHFHIISLTGVNGLKTRTISKSNITLHEISNFKIENIEEELKKHGLNLENQVDLVVSSWTLRHLVDPIGTVKQIYGLLDPKEGLFISTGFDVDAPFVRTVHSPAKLLFKDASRLEGGDFHFILERTSDSPLKIGLQYGDQISNDKKHDSEANKVGHTVYIADPNKKRPLREFSILTPCKWTDSGYVKQYELAGTEDSETLYNTFRDRDLFE